MYVTRQFVKQGRYAAPIGIDNAMKDALARLPERNNKKPASLLRAIALAACAVVLAGGIAVTSIPSARAYAEGLLRSVFKLYAGEPNNGFVAVPSDTTGLALQSSGVAVLPAATDSLDAIQQKKEQEKYKIISEHSVPINSSQTVNGIKATVLEAAIMDNRLFLGLEFSNVPQYCFPGEEYINIWIDGKPLKDGSFTQEMSVNGTEIFTVDKTLSLPHEELPASFIVRLGFNLRQFPDSSLGQGNVIVAFDMSFVMDRPAVFATLPPEENGSGSISTTSAPQARSQKPADDKRLSDPKGVAEWTTYTNAKASIQFEYPKAWVIDPNAEILPDLQGKAAMLPSYKGDGGSVEVYAVRLDAVDAVSAADYVVSMLFKSGGYGDTYEVNGKKVYFMRADEKNQDKSCIIIHLDKPIACSGEMYNILLIWAPKEYNNHILKSLVIN